MKTINLLIILLLTAAMAYPQHRVMQVHSEGEVAYEINTAQVDSVTFRQNRELSKEKCEFDTPLTDLLWLKDIIDEFEKNAETGNEVHAKIYQCTYKDGIGFLIEPCVGCPGAGYTLTSCEGEALCLMGELLGDPCTEFDIDFENKALIWEMDEKLSKTIKTSQIAYGNMLRNTTFQSIVTQRIVITNQSRWNALLLGISPFYDVSGQFSETEIDFTKYQVIVVIGEELLKEDCSIDIIGVMEYTDKIVVTYNSETGTVSSGDVRIRPFHIVKIPISDKEILFRRETANNDAPLEIPYMHYAQVESLIAPNPYLFIIRGLFEGRTLCQCVDLNYDDEAIVINSYEGLEKYILCKRDGYPEIDFSKHTLLLARGTAKSVISSKEMISIFLENSTNDYTLNLTIYLNPLLTLQPWHFSVLVPKLPDEATITLSVQYQ